MPEPPLSILYVDDEPLLLDITKEFLEMLGFRVDVAESGIGALQKVTGISYDAIVSDYQMPGMNGIELLKEIRKRNLDIPFILFTGRGREEVVIEAIENGADFYLQKGGKPIPQFSELTHKIKTAVSRRRDSNALRESELRFRSLIQNSSDIIRILDKDGKIIFDSPSSSTILGYPEGSLVGSVAFDLIHPDDRELVRSDFQDVRYQCNSHTPTEYRIRKADGTYLYVESIALNLIGVPGIDGIVTTTHPIQDKKMAELEIRKMAEDLSAAYEELASSEEELRESFLSLTRHEQALAKSEERFRGIAERTSDLILIIDEKMSVSYASPSSYSITGYYPEELMGKTQEFAMIVIFSESLSEFMHVVQSSLAGNQVTETEMGIRKKDGTSAFIEMSVVPVMHDGTFAGAQVTIKDITERRKTQEALRESERKFRALVEYSLDGILILDPQGTILFANAAAGKIIDIADPAVLLHKRNVMEFIAPESINNVIRDFNEVSHGVDGYIAQYKIITLLQEERWVESIGKSIDFQNNPAILISLRDITERMRSEETLRFTREKFTKAFLSSPDAITISELETGRFIEINDATATLYGHSPEEMTRRNSLELGVWVKPEDRDAFISLITTHGKIERYDVMHRRKSGELFHASISADVISLAGKKYIISTIRDISDRKQYENDLLETEQNARALINAQDEALFMLKADGTILYINDTTAGLLGHPVDEMIGTSMYQYLPPDISQRRRESVEQVVQSGEAVHYIDERFGHILEISIYPVFSESGEVSRIAVNGRDITEKLENDRMIVESEAKYRLLAEHVHDVIWTTNTSLELTYVSPSVLKIRGFTPEELVGKSIAHSMSPESYKKVMHYYEQLREFILKEEPYPESQIVELELCCKDGSTIWAELIISVVFDDNNQIKGLTGVTRDISQRKKVEEALRRANRQLNLLSGITRHDILNKISGIYAYLGMVEQALTDPRLVGYLQIMETEIMEIQSRIEFTRVYEDIGSHEPQWVPLDTIISRIPFTVPVTVAPELQEISIFADPMVDKVFFNLFDNSVRHGQGVSQINVFTINSGDTLTVVWEDNGIGIITEEKEQIFEHGFGKNTGLGMFLTREILSLTGMSIHEIGTFGEGARFEITIPKGAFRKETRISV